MVYMIEVKVPYVGDLIQLISSNLVPTNWGSGLGHAID
ncbi:hypothetical protein SPONN_677 [uncultured Candidatus Thioglobus sp.]|nr:hypothetical protein SPONN_677 [uncultured Candidatus Thioglobus sp.]